MASSRRDAYPVATAPKSPDNDVKMSEATNEKDGKGSVERTTKRLRSVPSEALEEAGSLEALLKVSLPDKSHFFGEWLHALASPSVCITSLADVRRLGAEDIGSLPVPPLVKGVFREVIARETEKLSEQRAVLAATTARTQQFFAPLRDRNMQPPFAGSKYFQDQKNYKLILTREEIQAGVRITAHKIEMWSKGERIILVAILKGAFMFLSDLCRQLTRPYSVYFVEASSYKDSRTQGAVQVNADLSAAKFVDATSKRPHKIVLIDELLDNGKTMQDMKQYLLQNLGQTHSENDVLTCCLFSKERVRDWPEADITGIPNLPDLWLVGYGLDDRGTKRGWTELFAAPKVKVVTTNDTGELKKLLAVLDDGAALKSQHVFADFELTCNHKCTYRVIGLDVDSNHFRPETLSGHDADKKITSKTDLEQRLEAVPSVKGKYETELHVAFIANNVHVVPEDEIFYGNNQAYAQLRCRLRKQIEVSADRMGVVGAGPPVDDDAPPFLHS